MAHEPRITLELGTDAAAAAMAVVLPGLGAFNATRLPAPATRYGVLARDMGTDAVLAGISVVVYGTIGYSHWAGWAVPAAEGGPALPAVVTRAARAAQVRGCTRLEAHVRAHDDMSPYEALGFRPTVRVPDHIAGGDYTVMALELPADLPPAIPEGVSLELREPISRLLAGEMWTRLDRRRQSRLPERPRWACALVRQSETVMGGALCYGTAGDFMVDMVWLDETLRGRNLGLEMLTRALEAGRDMGCTRAGVETMDCQAPGFYPKAGFAPIAYVPSDVPGMGMTFFRMRL
ncbi:GNAT family N-acetyltransferase [Indioceanicola profundi]|uniref:GNAT family N-acetyltransferase n=1 Tax=Indioceanicola profundi TaxID=2220096 RepID=UPI000E6AC720|nr:GNAT family N-acetyltransferase [Indioceanicola profundi]